MQENSVLLTFFARIVQLKAINVDIPVQTSKFQIPVILLLKLQT